MSTLTPTVFIPHTHNSHLRAFASIHISCIEQDNTIATFLPPLDPSAILEWWLDRAEEVEKGSRTIVMCLAGDREEVAGVVMLYKPSRQTGPHTGDVQKLLVSPDFRKRGVARLLMEKLESVGKEAGRWLFVSGLYSLNVSFLRGCIIHMRRSTVWIRQAADRIYFQLDSSFS